MRDQTPSSLQSGIIFKTLMIVLLVVGLGVGATYYFTDGFGQNTADESTADKQAEIAEEPADSDDQINESATGEDTLKLVELATKGKGSVKCTIDTMVEGKYSIATVYIKDKDHYRMDVRSDMGTVSTIVLDQTTNYTWLEGDKTGTKITLGAEDKDIQQQWQQYMDDSKVNPEATEAEEPRMSCGQTAVDDSLFELPKSVKFSDVSPYAVY